MNVVRSARRKLERLDVSTALYRMLGTIHLALVTDAGLLILACAPSLFGDHLIPKPISLVFLAAYVVCDLLRLRFLRGATISLGFPLVFLTLLADSPFAALVVAGLGSLVSEGLQSSFFSKQCLLWFATLRRAFFYAGHHTVAGLGALIAYQLTRARLAPWRLEIIHIQATLAYIIVYSLISMLLIWPHDCRVHLFLAPDEELFVRTDFFTTSLLLPIPASVFYLYHLKIEQAGRFLIVVGVLPLLFAMLFLVVRNFTEVANKQERLALRQKIKQSLGSPANMGETAERMLTLAGQLMNHRWSAVYSSANGELELRRCGMQPRKGPVIFYGPKDSEETRTSKGGASTNPDTVTWPKRVEPGEGVLGELVEKAPHSQYFHHGLASHTPTELGLPRKTAVIVFPITELQEEKETNRLIGFLALARPKRRFTTWDWEKGQALSSEVGNLLLSSQRLERAVRELLQKVRGYTRDLGQVYHATLELISRRVQVDRVLRAVCEDVFRGNLRTVLRSVVEGRGSNGIFITEERLAEIYNQVRIETAEPTMPPPDLHLVELLERVTSSLSPSVSFYYQSPNMVQVPVFRTFCKFLLDALEARTVPDIAAQGPTLERLVRDLNLLSLAEYSRIGKQLERFQQIIALLREGENADADAKTTYLNEASELLNLVKVSAQHELQGPEQFSFIQVATTWQTAVFSALYVAEEMKAELAMALNSKRALLSREVTMQLKLENRGSAIASRLVAEIQPSQDYQVRGIRRTEIGDLPTGGIREIDFTVKPKREHDPLYPEFLITYDDRERQVRERFCDRVYWRGDSPPFTKIEKVYVTGPALERGSSLFFGREGIFRFIEHNVNAPPAMRPILLLIGARRMGKTSILKQLSEKLSNETYLPVLIDCQRIRGGGMAGFFWRFCDAISEGLKAVGLSIECPSPTDLKHQPQFVFEKEFLPRVWERVGDRALLLAIDELDALYDLVRKSRLEPETFSYLRSLMQSQEKMAFVLVGTSKTEEHITRYESTFFNLAKFERVSFLERREALRLITEPVDPYGMLYDELALDEILRLTACHPYFLQLVCDCLVDHCNEKTRNYVTIQDVRDVQNSIVERGRQHLLFVWQDSSPAEKAVLSATVNLLRTQERVTAVDIVEHLKDRIGELADGLSFDLLAVTQALEQLTDRDIVRGKESPNGVLSYAFTAHLYWEWVSKHKSLNRIVPELAKEAA